MRHESPPSDRTCTVCHSTPGTYWCIDCFGPHLLCSVCCVSAHSNSPFHQIQRFNGQYFERADLDELGLVIDVWYHTHKCTPGNPHMEDVYKESNLDISDDDDDDDDDDILLYHGSGERIPVKYNLIIVSSTGIFKCWVIWCRCANAAQPYIQLLHAKLFLASFKCPSTTFTFEVLDHFCINALKCKTAAMNFISKLVQISNKAFLADVPVSIFWFDVV